jgi:hypothetical protein
MRLWILWLALLIASPFARAVSVLDVAPLRATPQDTIRMTLHLAPTDRLEFVNTFRYGSSIQVYVGLSDVIVPGQPPLPERTQIVELGRFPPGEYQIDIYVSGPSSVLLTSRSLGVVAAPAIPVLADRLADALAVVFLLIGALAIRIGVGRPG